MTPYEAMVSLNHRIIRYGVESVTAAEREEAVPLLLSARCSGDRLNRFYTAVRFPGNRDDAGRRLYPAFMIPPYHHGEKCRTILGQLPGTHILSANGYELEILRLLHLLAPEHPDVRDMNAGTIARLRHTCFANEDDGVGECFDTNLIALRYLGTVAPTLTGWLRDRIGVFHRHYGEKKRPWQTMWYFYLCLSELPLTVAAEDLERYRGEMLRFLETYGGVKGDSQEMLLSILRRCVERGDRRNGISP
ncbi:MAG: hypothetical protein IJB52_01920 [Clostridia bacterium]|nr:hypothetical protein [Clostridia bacterium]